MQEILSNKEQEEEKRLQKIDEDINEHDNDLAKSPKEYHLNDLLKPRSRAFRSSVHIKVKPGEGRARDRVGRKMPDQDN